MATVRLGVFIAGWVVAIFIVWNAPELFPNGPGRWVIGALLGLGYIAYQASIKVETLERRIARLEDELGAHQRFHGHRTQY